VRLRKRIVPPPDNLFAASDRLMLQTAEMRWLTGGTAIALEVNAMRKLEYLLSVGMALLLLGGMVAWTQASDLTGETALSCRSGKVAAPVVLKGMSIYTRCPAGKRG
jgi:hypothetical protein